MPEEQCRLQYICLVAFVGLLLWLEYGDMSPVDAAIALDHPEDPMTLKLERAGESHSDMLPLVLDSSCDVLPGSCYCCHVYSCIIWNL